MSFVALAPEHKLAAAAAARDPAAAAFVAECRSQGTSEAAIETAEKRGFDTGLRVAHPFLPGKTFPVWIANFVLMEYGTGAIFGCPAHDQRDIEFARKYGLPVTPVVLPPDADPQAFDVGDEAYVGPGKIFNSDFLNGLDVVAAKARAIAELERIAAGRGVTNWRLRDWGVSRQRYWGCPIPVIYCAACGVMPVPEDQLPVILPDDVTFDRPGNPLDHHPTWKHVRLPGVRRARPTRDRHVRRLRRQRVVFRSVLQSILQQAGGPRGGRSLAACRPVYRRDRARDPASALFPVLHPGDARHRPDIPDRAVRRAVHPGHGDPCQLQGRGWRLALSQRSREAGRWPHDPDRDRAAGGSRPDRGDVQVEAQHRRSRGDRRALRRRHGAMVHPVRQPARPRHRMDGSGRRRCLPLHPARVPSDRADRRAATGTAARNLRTGGGHAAPRHPPRHRRRDRVAGQLRLQRRGRPPA